MYSLLKAKTAGVASVLALYAAPLMVTNCWLVLYTWLQHTDVDIPHFDKERSLLDTL